MTGLVTAAEMRGIERDAIASGRVTGLGLMERAGHGVVEAIMAHWPRLASAPARARVLCGPGNNGGDGFVIARLLAERGWSVACHALGDPARLPPDARVNHDRWAEMGGVTAALTEAHFRADPEADILVDAIFGTGLTRAPEGALARLLRHLGEAGRDRLVAVDAPSGLCLDSGQMLGGGRPDPGASSVPLASLTVTFEVPKLGHFIADGPAVCGKLAIADLGLAEWRGMRRDAITGEPAAPGQAYVPRARLVDHAPLVAPAGPAPHRPSSLRKVSGHKYDHGHVLVIAGGQGRTGAARLAARAAGRPLPLGSEASWPFVI
ncbi:NAD(P)H-hydrate epimerase, partial [Rhodobacterales bacterium HKCCSP123]|nr:NAD(P)H-hydrate epimerase [Rhodobacterales bacterium HKCCSP123]